jgi:hypothetical protein
MWWNAALRTRIQLALRGGRVWRLEPISEGNCL